MAARNDILIAKGDRSNVYAALALPQWATFYFPHVRKGQPVCVDSRQINLASFRREVIFFLFSTDGDRRWYLDHGGIHIKS